MDWERATVTRCDAIARRRLALPERVEYHFRSPDPDASPGACDGHVVYLGLPAGSDRYALASVTFHELRHLADYHVGRTFDRGAWERDAEAYAVAMMGYFRGGTLPARPRREARAHGVAPFHLPPYDPADDAARAASLRAQIERRITRLARLRPADELALRAIVRPLRALEALVADRGTP
jgi:hypothetical protein